MTLAQRMITKPQLGGGESSLIVYGGGNLGGKVKGIYDNAKEIVASGIKLPEPGFVLASGFFDPIMEGQRGFKKELHALRKMDAWESGRVVDEIVHDDDSKSFSDIHMKAISRIAETLNGQLIAIRPSLEGESRGVGVTSTNLVYLSGTPQENIETLTHAIRSAFCSTFCLDALAYLDKKGLEHSAALWILPVLGNKLSMKNGFTILDFGGPEEFLLPGISACGYTLQTLDKKGTAQVVFGLGDQAVKGQGLVAIFDESGCQEYRATNSNHASAFSINSKFVREADVTKSGSRYSTPFINGDPRKIFERFAASVYALGKMLGSSHYFELATKGIIVPEINPILLQLAHASQYDLPTQFPAGYESDLEDPRLFAHNSQVVGVGTKICDKIIYVDGYPEHAIDAIRKLNLENKNYVLICSGYLLFDPAATHLRYNEISNAGAIVENIYSDPYPKVRTLEGHAKGLFMDSDILFLEARIDPKELGRRFGAENIQRKRLGPVTKVIIINKPVKVTVDERMKLGEIRMLEE